MNNLCKLAFSEDLSKIRMFLSPDAARIFHQDKVLEQTDSVELTVPDNLCDDTGTKRRYIQLCLYFCNKWNAAFYRHIFNDYETEVEGNTFYRAADKNQQFKLEIYEGNRVVYTFDGVYILEQTIY